MHEPVVLPLGDAAVTIRLGDTASVELARQAAAVASAIRDANIDGVTDVVSAVAAVSVYFDADTGDMTAAQSRVEAMVRDVATASSTAAGPSRAVAHTVRVRYDGSDLDEVAQRTGLTADDVIRRHSAPEYTVLALGFLPGWAYMGEVDAALALPRRASPRTRIPAGSVAIMGRQTGIYPRVSPGGWHLLGTTDAVLFAAQRERPALFAPGDTVRFVPV
jgi:KipI family sensor histidine kinase inhibitor